MTEVVSLFDVSSGRTYCVSLKPEDAQRAYNDPNLLTEILRVLASNYDDKDKVSNETSGSESPGRPTSSKTILKQPVVTTQCVTDIEQNEVSSTCNFDEIEAKHHPQSTEELFNGDESSNDSIMLPLENTTEFLGGSWCENDVIEPAKFDEVTKLKSNAFRWSDDAVHHLISQIDQNSDLVAANKKMNKSFWELIACKMGEKGLILTNSQCVSKWRKMISTYKSALSNGNRAAASSDALFKECPYFQAMDDLCKRNGWSLELFDADDSTNDEDPVLSRCVVTFESLLSFFDSHKLNNGVIFGRMSEQKYFELLHHLQIAGWEWAVRTSSKAPKDWYIFNYEKGDLKIPYFGHPFVLRKNSLLECVHGDSYYGLTNRRKERLNNDVLQLKNGEPDCETSDESRSEEEPPKKKRALKPTKKLSCPAFMKVVLIYYFPEYSVEFSEPLTWRSKRKVIQQLKRDVELNKTIETVALYYVKMSLPNSHNHDISPPKAIVTPMAPTPMKAYVDTHLVHLKDTVIKGRDSKLDEIRKTCSQIVELTNSPLRPGTSVKDLQEVLDKLREERQSMQTLFVCSSYEG